MLERAYSFTRGFMTLFSTFGVLPEAWQGPQLRQTFYSKIQHSDKRCSLPVGSRRRTWALVQSAQLSTSDWSDCSRNRTGSTSGVVVFGV